MRLASQQFHSTVKSFLTILTLTLLLTQELTGQELSGTINFWKYKEIPPEGILVIAKSVAKDALISTSTNNLGQFTLKLQDEGNFQIWIKSILEPDTTFNVKLKRDSIVNIYVEYPPKICPYDKTRFSKMCPQGGHTNNIIPIAYGLPTGATFRRAKRNEVFLGGCIVTDCDPSWYCGTHKLTF